MHAVRLTRTSFRRIAVALSLANMPRKSTPTTPLQILTFHGEQEENPFCVQQELAIEEELGDIRREETRALAQLIYNTYQEWKQQ